MGHIILADLDVYQNETGYVIQQQEKPPWEESQITIQYFPLSKEAAMNNPTEARALFNEIKHQYFRTTTLAYTDGFLNASTQKTTFAVVIPSLAIVTICRPNQNSNGEI